MNLYFRLFRVLIFGLFRKRIGVKDASRLALRAWPNDLDLNLHINNGRFLSLMDLGRFDLIARMGLLGTFLKKNWRPVVADAVIQFRRPIRIFQKYTLTSQIIAWDEKWIYIDQRFIRNEKILARGLIKGLIVSPRGSVPVPEVLKASGQEVLSPEFPEVIIKWGELQRTFMNRT